MNHIITPEFIEFSDKVIARFAELGFDAGNGNVVIIKPGVAQKTAGGIYRPDMEQELDKKKQNFARIASIPNNLDPSQGDMDLKVGNYCFYNFVAENPLHPDVLSSMLGFTVNSRGNEDPFITYTQDREIVGQVTAESIQDVVKS